MSFISDFDAIVDYPGLKPAELGLLVYFFRNQGESFIFHRTNILKKFCIKKDAYYTALNGLRDKKLITYEQLNEGKYGGLRITINMSVILAESGKTVSGKSESGKTVYGETGHGKPEYGKTVSGKSESGKTVSGKSGHINGVNIEGSKSIKGVNGVREGDSVPAAPCDTIPAPETQPAPQTVTPDIPPAPVDLFSGTEAALPVPAPEPRKRFTPPTVAEISQHISDKLQENNISWLPEQITGTAEIIFNFYDSKGWKVGKDTMKNWKSCVSGWLGRDNWTSRVRPRQSQQLPVPAFPGVSVNQQAPKSFREQDRDYANRHLRDPFGTAISDCVDAAIIMGGDPCDYGLAPQFHEEAMKLMQQRKAQAAKGHNINPDEVLTPGSQR